MKYALCNQYLNLKCINLLLLSALNTAFFLTKGLYFKFFIKNIIENIRIADTSFEGQ